MVVFTCGYCGDSVNKPKVEKHYSTKCRGREPNLSCMDCFKDFYGQDHEAHTKCVTEEQRYAASGFVVSAKKGETKQSVWVDLVQGVLAEQPAAPPGVLRILQDVSKHSNTPRKKPKFVNFVKNVSGHRTSPADIDGAWELIAVKLDQLKAANQQKGNSTPEIELNGSSTKENVNDALDDTKQTNGDESTNSENFENGQEPEQQEVKSKKERKELKKKRKYEAELRAAAAPPPEDYTEDKTSKKKGKDKQHESIVEGLITNKKNIQNENTELSGEKAEECKGKKNEKRKYSEIVDQVSNERFKVTDKVCYEKTEEHKTKKIKNLKNKVTSQDKEQEGNVQTPSEADPVPTGSFDWHGVILSVLQKKGGEVMYKRLQKKVLCEYAATTGREADDRAAHRLAKKLRSAKNVRIDKNRVVLVE